ncbi:MAG: hypothetical protein MSS66_04640 [Selenomonadaceae bacterium]|nr:hypothetical protein [Selenomonadaceae bacterium]
MNEAGGGLLHQVGSGGCKGRLTAFFRLFENFFEKIVKKACNFCKGVI